MLTGWSYEEGFDSIIRIFFFASIAAEKRIFRNNSSEI